VGRLRGDLHAALHPRRDSAAELLDRLLIGGLADNLVSHAVCHTHSIDRRSIEIARSLSHEPLTRSALLDEEELLRGVVEEEEDVYYLRSSCLRGARRHVSDRFIPGVFHHVLDKSSTIVRKACGCRTQILMDPPRCSDGAVEWVTVWGR